jgi:transposase
MGFSVVKALNKAFIHPRNQAKRLEFSNFALDKGIGWMDTIVWSDETMVRSLPQGKQVRFWMRDTVPKEERPINGQFQGGGITVMFWGCFSVLGTGPLVAIEGTMDQHKYIELLREHVLPEFRAAKELHGKDMIFMQDNAPCHKAKSVVKFIEDSGIPALNWPPQSPDLNPIENLWAYIKKKLESENAVPTTKSALIEAVFNIWENLDPQIVANLASSVPRRFSACLNANGKHTKY